jgi:hypothetical protein
MSEFNGFTCVACDITTTISEISTLKLAGGVEVHYCTKWCEAYKTWHCHLCGKFFDLGDNDYKKLNHSNTLFCNKCYELTFPKE